MTPLGCCLRNTQRFCHQEGALIHSRTFSSTNSHLTETRSQVKTAGNSRARTSRTGHGLKKMTSQPPPNSDPRRAPASTDACTPLRTLQEKASRALAPSLAGGPQTTWAQHWVDRRPVSGHGELSSSLNTGKIQSWHSSCYLRKTKLLAPGKIPV